MGSLPHRGEDNGYVDARFFGNENLVHYHQERKTHQHDRTQHMYSLYNSPGGLYDYASHLHLYAPRYSLYHGQYRSVQCPHHTPVLTYITKGRVQLPSAQDIVAGSPVRAMTNLEED